MERLARHLEAHGQKARVLCKYTPEQWRKNMSTGAIGRLKARVGSSAWFPIVVLWHCLWSRRSILVPTTNPFFLPFLVTATKPLHRQKVAALIYDLYPDALIASGHSRVEGLASRLMAWANMRLFSKCDAVVFIGALMGAHARERYGQPRKWAVFETGADMDEFSDARLTSCREATPLENWCEGRTVFGYVGNMGEVHDWETLAKVVPSLLEGLKPQPRVLVAGSGPGVECLKKAWEGHTNPSIRFEAPLDDGSWARLLPKIEVSLVSLRREALFTSIPSKVFSAMAAGSAVLAIAPRGSDLAQIVERHSCGVVVEPGDSDGLRRSMLRLLHEHGYLASLRANAKTAVREQYGMDGLASRWAVFLADV